MRPVWGTLSEALHDVATERTILDELPTSRAAIFRLMKTEGFVSVPRIAEVLGVSHEAARKHVVELQRNGWIEADCEPEEAKRREPFSGGPRFGTASQRRAIICFRRTTPSCSSGYSTQSRR